MAAAPQVDWSTATPITPQVDWSTATPIDGQSESTTAASPEGFWHSLGAQFGVTPEAAQAAIQNMKDHPVKSAIMALAGPAGASAEGLYEGAKRSGSELLQASKDAFANNRAGAAYHGVKAVPFVGPGMDKAADQYAEGNTAGELGTLVGTAVQAAPVALGAADAAGMPRPDTSLTNVATKVSPSLRAQEAGKMFQSIAKDANSTPVSLDNSSDAALRLMDWQGKTQLGPSINKFLNRITKPKAGPLTYGEARDFYQVLGRLSADETSKLPPAVQGDLAKMVNGFKTDIGNAADQVGRASDYYQAMGDYATAMRLKGWYQFARKVATRGVLGSGVAYEAYKQYQKR